MKALVTGGAGFIGSNLVDALLARGDEVIVFDNFSTGFKDNLKHNFNKIDIFSGSINNGSVIGQDYLNYLSKYVDVIYHLAARISVPESIDDPIGTHKVNVDGTLSVLEAARVNGCRVVFASSSAVYGDRSNAWADDLGIGETDNTFPCSPYGATKLIGEKYCGLYTRCYNVPTACLRFFNVYGPRQNVNSGYAAAIPKFINSLLKDESPVIYGNGEQTRSFTYVDDVVNALILAGSEKRDYPLIANISTWQRTSINNLVDIIKIELEKTSIETIYKGKRAGDILHSAADVRDAKYKLGFEAKVGLDDGLIKTINYYKGLV